MAFLDELAGYGDRVPIRPQDEHGLLDLLAAYLGDPRDDVKVYCCGPAPLLDAVEAVCAALAAVRACAPSGSSPPSTGAPVRERPVRGRAGPHRHRP